METTILKVEINGENGKNMEGGKIGKTELTGTVIGVDVTASEKVWRLFQAIGDIAFSYAFTTILIEIQVCTDSNFMYSFI